MNNIVFPVTPQRSLALRLERAMSEVGFDQYIYSPHWLRFEALVTTATNYTFDFYQQTGVDAATENKLNRTDAFFVSHIGLSMYKNSERSQAVLRTWPDPFVFTNASEAAELEQVYNGELTFRTQPVERISPLSCQMFRYDPGRIQDADPVAVSVALGNSLYGPEMSQKGFISLEPSVIIAGYQDNKITLEIPGPAFSDAASQNNYIVIQVAGFLVDQGADRFRGYNYATPL